MLEFTKDKDWEEAIGFGYKVTIFKGSASVEW